MSDTLVSPSASHDRGRRPDAEADLPFKSEFESADAYATLKRMAVRRLGALPRGLTLNPTMLVNEAFLKMMRTYAVDGLNNATSNNAFYAVASETMRRIVIDYFRHRNRKKRGAGRDRVMIDVAFLPDTTKSLDLMALNEAISRFELIYPHKAELVKLRFFASMTMPECATALGVSLATAERHWRFARAWLAEALKD